MRRWSTRNGNGCRPILTNFMMTNDPGDQMLSTKTLLMSIGRVNRDQIKECPNHNPDNSLKIFVLTTVSVHP